MNRNILLYFFIMIIGFISIGCSTLNSKLKVEQYEVDPIETNSVLVFEKKPEYENEGYEAEKNEIIISCSKHLASKGFKIFNKNVSKNCRIFKKVIFNKKFIY